MRGSSRSSRWPWLCGSSCSCRTGDGGTRRRRGARPAGSSTPNSMLTLRRRSSLDATTVTPAAGRPVLLATLDVPFSEEATAFAVDSAVESGQPLVLVNVAEVLPTAYTFLGYGYVEREDLQDALRKPAEL